MQIPPLRIAIAALLCLGVLAPFASAQDDMRVTTLTDPTTGRSVQRYQSPHHENHHYYFISPWSPDEKHIAFFRFDKDVDKLTSRGRYPGSLWLMDVDGGNRRKLVDGLHGHYHVGVSQFWGPKGEYVYYSDTSSSRGCMARVSIHGGEPECIETPVPCRRTNPDNKTLSCGTAEEWGIFDLATKSYERRVTVERVLALTPNKALAVSHRSVLPNTRLSPAGDKALVVHVAQETYPPLIEMHVYDIADDTLSYLTHDLHHPGWRPDGKAVIFVRWDNETKMQGLWEVAIATKKERPVFNSRHVPAGHPSYHPTKPHLVVTDCYGGEFGNGLAILNLKTGEMKQLISIPLGSKAETYPDERFEYRNHGLWMPPRKYLNEPRPVWNKDGTKVLYTSQESGRMNLYVIDTSDLQ